MAFAIPYLKTVAAGVADAFELSVVDASRIVAFYSVKNDKEGVAACEALKVEAIKEAAAAVGVVLPGSDADGSKADSVTDHGSKEKENISVKDHGGADADGRGAETVKHSEKTHKLTENTPKKENNNDSIINKSKSRKTAKSETVLQNADAIKENNTGIKENTRGGGALVSPSGFVFDLDTVDSIINDFSLSCRLDEPHKMAGSQWRSCCLLVGSYVSKHRILEDMEKNARHGGKNYDIDKINFCIDLFEFSCGKVRKAPLISDFLAFSGVSSSFFYNTNGRCVVTSAGVDLRKKLQDMQQAGIASGIVNDRENPTGKIYFSKAVLGWSENNNAAPIQEEKSQSVAALPVFGAPDDN